MTDLETPKKISHQADLCFLCKKAFSTVKNEKIKVFGKSCIDINSLILRATKVNLLTYVGCENLAICVSCYSRFKRYQNAIKKVDEFEYEIKRDFEELIPLHTKRMAKDEENIEERMSIKRSLNFGEAKNDNSINVEKCTITDQVSTAKAQPGAIYSEEMRKPLVTSTPVVKVVSDSSASSGSETKVYITVHYPSKLIRKELKTDFASLGKAIANGSPERVARAVLKNADLKTCVVKKVLRLLTTQVNGLCSRRVPSILRAKTKDELIGFELKNVCLEWKERAPLLYAFLMTVASSKKESDLVWLSSVAVAGSILLKQRNPHMNGCATVLGIILKSRSLEVCSVYITVYVLLKVISIY